LENAEYFEAIGNPCQFHCPFAARCWTVRKAAKNRTKTKVDNNKPRRENRTKETQKKENAGKTRKPSAKLELQIKIGNGTQMKN